MHDFESDHLEKHVVLNKRARKRYLISFLIYALICGFDIALTVLAVPTRQPQKAVNTNSLGWDNSAPIPDLNRNNIIIGSFSKSIKLPTAADDIEFTRLPSFSVERTDVRDFGLEVPPYTGILISCTSAEQWRLKCQVFCENRFYQFKLRLDVSTDNSESFFFVPTSNMTVRTGNNTLKKYVDAIEDQLGIEISGYSIGRPNDEHYFDIRTDKIAQENTTLQNGDSVLTHDAVASIFLNTIKIFDTAPGTEYFERKAGEREEKLAQVSGNIAVSQRPHLPSFGTARLYFCSQCVSIVLHKTLHRHSSCPELNFLLEMAGVACTANFANLKGKVLPLRYSMESSNPDMADPEAQKVKGHVGYYPGKLVGAIKEYHLHGKLDEHRQAVRFGFVDKETMREVKNVA